MDYHNCPECGLSHIQQRKTAQTVGQVVGAVGGIVASMLWPMSGNKLPIPKLPQQVYQYITFAKTGSVVGGEIGMVYRGALATAAGGAQPRRLRQPLGQRR